MIATVHVGVALKRPPMLDEIRRYKIQAESATEAAIIAIQMAACTCVTPIAAQVIDIDEI